MVKVFIGVGSNIEPEVNVRKALRLLCAQVRIIGISTFYRTEPIGKPEQAFYINGVVEIETDLAPDRLKESVLLRIETDMGRQRTGDKYDSRVIDLDILLYDSLPDWVSPDIAERSFLAVSLQELSPNLVLPNSGTSIADIASMPKHGIMMPLYQFTDDLRREIGNEQGQS